METSNTDRKLYGVLAEAGNPKELLNIAMTVKNSGYRIYDTYSPFPIHGMDQAMNLKKSKLGWIVLGHGLTGFFGALSLIYFTMAVDYPLNIGGKTLLNFPAWIPVTFELTILLSAFGAVFGMFFLNGLPRLNHPLFSIDNFSRATDDGFFICIESEDPQFEKEKVKKLFADAGVSNIEEVYDD
ncbi:MAG: DUF3341 domain-containing protein [Balneolaceae bacterium]